VFHGRQRERSWSFRDASGARLGQRIEPLARVGVYVPGGRAAYPSTVLMTVIPARVAGVGEVIAVSPVGKDGDTPIVLAACQLAALPRRAIPARALVHFGAIVIVRSLAQALEIANHLAPEHLELAVRAPRRWLARVRHAGAVFLGQDAPEAFGDYLAGPNHVLPTGGTARFASPLGVYDFVKRTSIIEAGPRTMARLGPAVVRLPRLDGLDAHG